MTQRTTYDETKQKFGKNARKLAESSIVLSMRRQNGRQSDEADKIIAAYLKGDFGPHDKDKGWTAGLNYKNGISPEKKMLLMLGRKGSDVKSGGVVGIMSRALDRNEEIVQKDMVAVYLDGGNEFIVQVQRNSGKVQDRINKRKLPESALAEKEKPAEKKATPAKKPAAKKATPAKKPAAKKATSAGKKLTVTQQQKALEDKRAANAKNAA